MSKWWMARLVWLGLGLLLGVIALLPEAAGVATGMLALVHIGAWFVILGRWAVVELGGTLRETREKVRRASAGAAVADAAPDEDRADPRKYALVWDSALFVAAVAGCAALFAVGG